MATSLLNNIIDRYLSNILEINKEETKLSLWSGTLEMNNVKFKKEIFNTINLPYLELVNGYIGKMKLTLSLPRFYLYPIQLEINDMFFHAKKRDITNLKRDEEIKLLEEYKTAKLKSKEEFLMDIFQLTYESPNILEQILHNLNIEIKNVVFRLEDAISFPHHPYSFGAILSKAVIESQNELPIGNQDQSQNNQHISNKKIRVNNLSIYLDSKLVNKDIEFINLIDPSERDAVEKKQGQYLSELIDFYAYGLSEINVHSQAMSSHQYIVYQLNIEMKIVINNTNFKKNNQPEIYCDITYPHIQTFISIIQIQTIMRVIAYFHLKTLYQLGICKEYYTKQLSLKDKDRYVKTYREYYQCKYIQGYLNDKEADELYIQLSSIEKGIRYETISQMRSFAIKDVNHIRSLEEINKQIEIIEAKWIISAAFRQSELKRLNDIKAIIIKKMNKIKEIEGNRSENTALENKSDDMLFYIQFSIKRFDITLKENSIKKIAMFTLNGFNFELSLKKISISISFSLRSLSLVQFIKVDEINKEIISTNVENDKLNTQNKINDNKVIQLDYEYNPQFAKSSHQLRISNQRRLDIVLNYYILMYIYRSINVGLKETIYFSELNAYAQEEVGKYIKEGYIDAFLSGNYDYFNIDIDVQFMSPLIVLPISSNRQCAKISFGLIKFYSLLSGGLKEKQLKPEYDQYNCVLNSINVIVGKDNNPNEDYLVPSSIFSVNIKTLKDKTKAEIDYNIIEINMPIVKVSLSEKQLMHIMSFIDRIKRDNVDLNKLFPKEETINEYYNNQNIIKQYIKEKELSSKSALNDECKPESVIAPKEVFNKSITEITNPNTNANANANANAVKCLCNIGVVELDILKTVKQQTKNNTDVTVSQQFIQISLTKIGLDMKMKVPNDFILDFSLNQIEIIHYNSDISKKPSYILMTKSSSSSLSSSLLSSSSSTINEDSFLAIHFAQSDLTTINVILNQIVFECHYNTVCLIYKFAMFYYQTYSLIQISIDNEMAIDNLAEDYNDYISLKKQSKTDKEINKNFMEKLKQKISTESRKQLLSSPSKRKKTKKRRYSSSSGGGSVSKVTPKSNLPTNSRCIKNILNVKFNLKAIEIAFYYEYIKVFQLNSKLTLNHSSDSLIDIVTSDLTNKVIHYNYQRKNEKTVIEFNINSYTIHHTNSLSAFSPNITDYTLTYNQTSFINLATSSQITKIELIDSPLTFTIDFNQIQTILNLMNQLPQMKNDFNSKYIPLFSIKEFKSLNPNVALSSIMVDYSYQSSFQMKMNQLRSLIQYERMYNIAHFSIYNDLSIILKPISVKLINSNMRNNNTFLIAVFRDFAFKYIHNSDPSDGTNLANFLLEIIAGKDIAMRYYDVRQLYHYLFSTLELEVNIYNRLIKQWESLVEPFKLEAKAMQVGKTTKKRIQITSETMLNLNVSFNALKVYNEIKNHYRQALARNLIQKCRSNKPNKSTNEVVVINEDSKVMILNSSGMEVRCWFGIIPKEKYTLVSGQKISLSKSVLNAMVTDELVNNDKHIKLNEEDKNMLMKQNDVFYFSIANTKTFSFQLTPHYYGYYKLQINTQGIISEHDIIIKTKVVNDSNYTISFESNISFCNQTNIEDIILTNTEATLSLLLPYNINTSVPNSVLNNINTSYYISTKGNEENRKVLFEKISDITDDNNKAKAKIIALDDNTHLSIAIRKLNTSNVICVSPNEQNISASLYEIIIQPALIIFNATPFPLNFIASSCEDKPTMISKLERINFYGINPIDTNDCFSLAFEVNKQVYKSDSIFMTNNKSLSSIFLSDINTKETIECGVIVHDNNDSSISDNNSVIQYDSNQLKVIEYKSHSISLTFYFKYLYINRTNIQLAFKSSTCNKEYNLNANSINPMNIKDKSIQIKSIQSDWSDAIDISVIGTKSIIKLSTFKKAQGIHPSSVGLMTTIDKDYVNTTLVIFDRRYTIINQLKNVTIDYKQSDPIESTIYELKYQDEKELMYRNDTRLYQIRLNDINNNEKDLSSWSSSFNVDLNESFDLKLKCNNKNILKSVPIKNIFSNDNNITQFALIKVIIKTLNENSVYILITFPQYPYMQIDNKTSLPITILESDTNNKSLASIKVNSKNKMPFVPSLSPMQIHQSTKLQCRIGNEVIPFSYSHLEKKTVKEYVFIVYLDNNSTRTMRIEEIRSKSLKDDKLTKQLFNKCQGTKLKISCKGLGISILNSEPKELFYISVYGIDCLYNSNTTVYSYDSETNTFESLIVYIKNVQIDDCFNDKLFLPIIAPQQQVLPQNEDKLLNNSSNEAVVPFIQLLINRETISINLCDPSNTTPTTTDSTGSISKYRQIDITIKEFNVVIEQSSIDTLLSFQQAYVNLNNNDNESEMAYNDSNPIIVSNEEDVIVTTTPIIPYNQLEQQLSGTSMAIIDYLLLGAIKFNLTLRINVGKIDLFYLPQFALNIIGALGNSLAKITNLPLQYNELIYENIFIEQKKILHLLQEYYFKTTLKQIYKVLGYNDLIGNPLQLINNIGTGFFELVNEPRKGFIQGTSQFEKGLEKGINSFVKNVVGGGFSSISNISGTLLSASKNLQGENGNMQTNKPKNFTEGTIKGFKDGISQLSDGISGIITNPYANAKKEGALGFFKGVGQGLTKAVFCPITSALTVTTNITQGISSSLGNNNSNSNIPMYRFRNIRTIKKNGSIMPYDYSIDSNKKKGLMEEVSSMKFSIEDTEKIKLLFKLPKDTVLLLNSEFHIMTKGSEGKLGRIIITNNLISAIIEESDELIFKTKISKLYSCQMQFTNSVYTLIFLKKNFKIKKLSLAESIVASKIKEIIKSLLTY